MQRVDSLEKTLMLGGIGGRRRRGQQVAGWHHQLNGHEFGWTPGVGVGQGGLAWCNSWDHKESDMTEQRNWTELNRTMCQTLRFLDIVSHLIFKRTLWGRYCYFQCFIQHAVNTNFKFSVFIIALNRTQCRSGLAKFQKSEHIHETPISTANYCCPSDFKRASFLTFPCSALGFLPSCRHLF